MDNKCIKCGCDNPYVSQPPSPTPPVCPNPQPCAEFFDAQCVVYTGPNLVCGTDIIITSGSSVADAFADLISYLKDTNILSCAPIVCTNAYVYLTNAVIAGIDLPAIGAINVLNNILSNGIVISNGSTGICCPTCGPYIFTGVEPFAKYCEAVGDFSCCNNIYGSTAAVESYNSATGGNTTPCNNGFTAAATSLSNSTGNPIGILETGIVENGSLNDDLSTNIPNIVTMINAFIAADPATTVDDVVQILLNLGLVVYCCTDSIFIGSMEAYLLWLEAGGCNTPPN